LKGTRLQSGKSRGGKKLVLEQRSRGGSPYFNWNRERGGRIPLPGSFRKGKSGNPHHIRKERTVKKRDTKRTGKKGRSSVRPETISQGGRRGENRVSPAREAPQPLSGGRIPKSPSFQGENMHKKARKTSGQSRSVGEKKKGSNPRPKWKTAGPA